VHPDDDVENGIDDHDDGRGCPIGGETSHPGDVRHLRRSERRSVDANTRLKLFLARTANGPHMLR